MSSELANRIKILKRSHTSADIVKNAGVSRETLRKIESGELVKLSTIKNITDYLGANSKQWSEIVIAWTKLALGDEAKNIQFIYESGELNDREDDAKQILSLANQLDSTDRKQIILTMTRPEVRRSLTALNNLFDSVKRKGK